MRKILAWAFYGLGHFVSLLMERMDFLASLLYPIYNSLMNLSDSIQGEGPGPWISVDTGEKK